MLNLAEVGALLIPFMVVLLALYWVVRLAVAAGIHDALPDLLKNAQRGDGGYVRRYQRWSR